MISPMDIGMDEAGPIGEGSMFALKSADKTEAMRRLNRGKMVTITEAKPTDEHNSDSDDDESDPEEDRLERDLDSMYENYKERKSESDAKYRAKKAREHRGDEEWEGLSAGEGDESDSSALEEEEEEDSSSDEDEGPAQGLLKNFDEDQSNGNGLSSRAAAFFNQDIFKGITEALPKAGKTGEDVVDEDEEIRNLKPTTKIGKEKENAPARISRSSTRANAMENGDKIEVIPGADEEDDWERKETRRSDGKPGTEPRENLEYSFANLIMIRYRYHHC